MTEDKDWVKNSLSIKSKVTNSMFYKDLYILIPEEPFKNTNKDLIASKSRSTRRAIAPYSRF